MPERFKTRPPSSGEKIYVRHSLIEVAGCGHLIVGADLNAKHPYWGGTAANAKGRILYEWIMTIPDVDVLRTREPSRPNTTNGSFIDLFIISQGLMGYIEGGSHTELRTIEYESDHKAVELLVTTGEVMKKELITVFDYQAMDTTCFNNILTEKLTAVVLPKDRDITEDEVDAAVLALTDAYGAAMIGSIKKTTVPGRFLPRLPDEILDLIRQKKGL